MNPTTMDSRRPDVQGDRFVFSTQDFARCLRPMKEYYLHPDVHVNIDNQTHGDFIFVGTDYIRKRGKLRCDARLTVPRDKIILFELLDIVLPCETTSLRIYNSTAPLSKALVILFCENYKEDLKDNRFILPFHTAVVTLNMFSFSHSYVMHLRFSAIPQSEGYQLQHIIFDKHKGAFFFLPVTWLAWVAFIRVLFIHQRKWNFKFVNF